VFKADKERFIYHASLFLECLRLMRRQVCIYLTSFDMEAELTSRQDPTRPLIMIGHSLGGILIKQVGFSVVIGDAPNLERQALVNAHNNSKYKTIREAT
jgi:hypothetical protein